MLAANEGPTSSQFTSSDFIREAIQRSRFELSKNEPDVMRLILQFCKGKKP